MYAGFLFTGPLMAGSKMQQHDPVILLTAPFGRHAKLHSQMLLATLDSNEADPPCITGKRRR